MLAAGVIEPTDSPWASPVCLAKKPDGSYRFCVDYRRVNAVSRKDAYSIPDIQDAFDSLRGGGEIFRDHRSSFGVLADRHDAQGSGTISILHPW